MCGTVRKTPGESVLVSVRQNAGRHLYWNGRRFRSRKQLFKRAQLLPAHGKRALARQWLYRLGLPRPDGGYTLRVKLVRRGGLVVRRLAMKTLAFTIDTVAPPAPVITSGPPASSAATRATLSFTDSEPGLVFACQLDGQSSQACASPATFSALGVGHHTFAAQAVDRAGNVSAPAIYSWSVTVAPASAASSPALPFTVSGHAIGLLYPGGPADTIVVDLSNPGDTGLYVTGLTVALDVAALPAGCSASNFAIRQPTPTPGLYLPGAGSLILPATASATIRMIDLPSPQNACAGASLVLSYSGSAHT